MIMLEKKPRLDKLNNQVLLLLFLLNPFFGAFAAIIVSFYYKGNKTGLNFLSILISLYISFINVFKGREIGDVVSIQGSFEDASKFDYLGFLEFMFEEPVYSSLLWIINRLSFGNFNFFILITSFVFYYLLSKSLISISYHFKLPFKAIRFSLIFLFFFPLIFTWSFHLTRQVLAISFFIYFLTNQIVNNKFKISLLVLSILTHTSIALYLPLVLFLYFKGRFSKTLTYPLFGLILTLWIVLYSKIISFFAYTSAISERFEEAGYTDGNEINTTIYYLVILILIYVVYKIMSESYVTSIFLNYFIYTSLIIIVTITILPLISYRFTVNFYILLPFVFLYFIKKTTGNYIYIGSFLILIWFNYYLLYGPYYYGSILDIYFNNIFNNFYGLFI